MKGLLSSMPKLILHCDWEDAHGDVGTGEMLSK